jgi:hypothetical protein
MRTTKMTETTSIRAKTTLDHLRPRGCFIYELFSPENIRRWRLEDVA